MKRELQAEVMSLLLRCNCIDVEEIIQWADLIIEEDPEPPYTVIELSLLGNSNPVDVERKLNEISSSDYLFDALRETLGQIWKRISAGREVDLESITMTLEEVSSKYYLEIPNDLGFLNGISDYTYLEFVSGSTESEAEAKLINEFRRFYSEDDMH